MAQNRMKLDDVVPVGRQEVRSRRLGRNERHMGDTETEVVRSRGGPDVGDQIKAIFERLLS